MVYKDFLLHDNPSITIICLHTVKLKNCNSKAQSFLILYPKKYLPLA